MFHLERQAWMRVLACSGGLLMSGCANLRGTLNDLAPPGLTAELPHLQTPPEAAGGRRAPKPRSLADGMHQTSHRSAAGDDDEIIVLGAAGAPAQDDGEDIEQTRFVAKKQRLKKGDLMLEAPPPMEAAIVSDAPIDGHHGKLKKTKPRDLLASIGVELPHKAARHRRDMGNNPNVTRELRLANHPLYVVEPPDVLFIEATDLLPNKPVFGERLVRQDGTISLGFYGQIAVAGLTLPEIEEKIRERLGDYVNTPEVYVDVASFNSKVFYVLGQVQQTGRLPITGKETVLDGIVLAGGPTNFADLKRVYLARPNPGGGCDQVFHIDYKSITQCGDTRTNYQLLPGDRIFVAPTGGYKTLVAFDNYLTPIERVTNLFALFRFATESRNR